MLDLNKMVDSSSTELDIENSLEMSNLPLASYLKKMHYGGRIRISGTDIGEVSRSIVNRSLAPERIQELLYDGRIKTMSIFDIISELEENNFVILKKIMNNYKYYIEAERANPV